MQDRGIRVEPVVDAVFIVPEDASRKTPDASTMRDDPGDAEAGC